MSTPFGVELVRVEDAKSMLEATLAAVQSNTALIAAAAVGDYGVASKLAGKTDRRTNPKISIALEANPDIVATVQCAHKFGFAAELPEDLLRKAHKKIVEKGLKGIFGNTIDAFKSSTNSGVLISPDGSELPIPMMSKDRLARVLVRSWLLPLAA